MATVPMNDPVAAGRRYERHVAEGRYLVTVGTADEALARDAERTLHAHGGADVQRYGAAA